MLERQDELNSRSRRRLNLVWLSLPPLLLASFIVGRNNSQSGRLDVNDPRPVAKAVRTLEDLCQCVITYEDPRIMYSRETKDVTDEIRRSIPANPRRVIVPKGGALTLNYRAVPGTDRPVDLTSTLNDLLTAHEREDGAGKFRIENSNGVIHVIPVAVKNINGKIQPQASVLDAAISLPRLERTGIQTLTAILGTISKKNHMRVELGAVPLNLLLQHRSIQGFDNEQARTVLIRFLQDVDKSGRLSWRLLYEPGIKTYALNIHRIS